MTNISELIRNRFGIESSTQQNEVTNGTIENILTRRSFRRYLDREISEDLRKLLFACAQSASAKSDLQQYSIIDIRDQKAKDQLAELSGSPFMEKAPVVLVFCGDIRRVQRISELRGLPFAQNTLDNFMNAVVDATLAMQTYILAAEANGLGCCPISHVRNDLDEVRDLLGLPEGVFPVAGLTTGWPSEERDVTLRLPPAVVIHHNTYDDKNLPEEISAYDQRRHNSRPIPETSYLHTDEFGSPAFYGWSENIARRLAKPNGLEGLRTFLMSHGFDLT
jgi:nitroreductase/FMN reductase [NAD(P)H]